MVMTALPTSCSLQDRLEQALDPAFDVTGTWQNDWQLFSPSIDKINTFVSARIHLSDGTAIDWRSPDWREMNAWDRFRNFRLMAYYDAIRLDENEAAWPSLARYLAGRIQRTLPPHTHVDSIEIARHWSIVPPPPENGLWPSASDYRDEYSRYVIYETTFPPGPRETY